ncbi:hypothetical protein [Pedobacter nototheniae]|uniref:hypothetical protein n=1 Tax=Pedobacter nototheniae TaxID=2488994 RepID=UPI00103B123B|nr:hypothetical protein [Pedobacter nototheniae]
MNAAQILELVKAIGPLLGVILGAALTFSWTWFLAKHTDKRKLKKLLFHLLELRYHLGRESAITQFTLELKPELMNRLMKQFDGDFKISYEEFVFMMQKMMPKNPANDNRMTQLEANIDQVILELAEIYPIFAYEPSGQYQIKERIAHISHMSEVLHEMPFDYKAFIQPKMNKNIMDNIEKNILSISGKIGMTYARETRKKLLPPDKINAAEVEEFIDEYVKKILTAIEAQNSAAIN